MLNLESVLCSARSLLFGLPLGMLGAYGVYLGMGLSISLPFEIPWAAIAQCVAGVLAVTWITMRYCAGKIKNGSIVEAIRRL